MNKKLISGLVLIGVVALVALFGTDSADTQLVAKKKSHERWWIPGCPLSDAYQEQCENAGGILCGENQHADYECCNTVDGVAQCEDKKVCFWGHCKEWKQCQDQKSIGPCP